MTSDDQPDNCDSLAALRDVRTALRSDLQITRQLTKGEAMYVAYDPVSFQAHRLGLLDYRVTAQLNESRTLGDCFQALVRAGVLDTENEREFYQFVAKLDSFGLLTTSNQDADALFQQFQAKEARRKGRYTSLLFMTIPLANPDRFLQRTGRYFSLLYSRLAILPWVAGMICALLLVWNRWSDFVAPLNGILAVQNLFFLSIAFVGLKIWHELGHGYACQRFGGRVPEMGCKLIVGMPLAYVDATSAWGFPNRIHRIIVMLGGMYFESLIAIPAVFVWAFLPETLIGSCAYKLIIMAGVASIFFNANPLLRYDGYFILSDLLGMPNLRSKSRQEVTDTIKKLALGLPRRSLPNPRERWILLTYGVSSHLYFVTIICSIALVIAVRFQIVGLCFLVVNLGILLLKRLRKLYQYLLLDEETEPVRARARSVAGLGTVAVVLLLLILPIPAGVQIPGLVTAQQSTTVRADAAGTLVEILGKAGAFVEGGQPIVRLQEIDTSLASETDHLQALAARRGAHFVSREDMGQSAKLHFEADALWTKSEQAQHQLSELTIKAPHAGKLVLVEPDYGIGTYVKIGDPVAKVVAGQTIIRAWLDEEQLAAAKVEPGSSARIRLVNDASFSCRGTITCIAPVSVSEFNDLALTTEGEGKILFDQRGNRPEKPLFQMTIAVDPLTTEETLDHVRANVLLGRKYEPLLFWLVRHGRTFVSRIFAA